MSIGPTGTTQKRRLPEGSWRKFWAFVVPTITPLRLTVIGPAAWMHRRRGDHVPAVSFHLDAIREVAAGHRECQRCKVEVPTSTPCRDADRLSQRTVHTLLFGEADVTTVRRSISNTTMPETTPVAIPTFASRLTAHERTIVPLSVWNSAVL
ncbi:MAG TPA: hypothetical protein VK550_33290 [Polyangiaceae bacterium]|nr:hypothetical protein [Polyangiaceae bacterium]